MYLIKETNQIKQRKKSSPYKIKSEGYSHQYRTEAPELQNTFSSSSDSVIAFLVRDILQI